jgi:DNA-binding GntR family transcriptional regulator
MTNTLLPPKMIKAFQTPDDVLSIVENIKDDIFLGKLKPRERLVELSLCEKLNVKRNKLRKALMELERLGFVKIEPNKGATVRDFELDEIEQIIQMRRLLEEQAARLIPLPVSAEVLADLTKLQKRHAEALAKEDMLSGYKLNHEFHDILYSLCGNTYLVEMIKYFTNLIEAIKSRRRYFKLIKNSPQTHLKIISALKNEDREELVRLLSWDQIKTANAYYNEMRKWWAEAEQREITIERN